MSHRIFQFAGLAGMSLPAPLRRRVALHRATAPGRGWNLRGEIRAGAK